jgi:hypothetical protein
MVHSKSRNVQSKSTDNYKQIIRRTGHELANEPNKKQGKCKPFAVKFTFVVDLVCTFALQRSAGITRPVS